VKAAGGVEEDWQLVVDEFAAVVGEDGRPAGQACAVLLAAAGGKPFNAAAVYEYGAADCGVAGTSGMDSAA
jgi:hypothetical protein